jgi:hypothetical protein
MYHIRSLSPRTDISMGCHGFQIDLHPEFRDFVERTNVGGSKIEQGNIDRVIELSGNRWLDACGYSKIHEGRRLYEARSSLRVAWGEWGPEHIHVPGNACGLDIERDPLGCIFPGGVSLLPHNIDVWHQKQLLLIVFTDLAETILLLGRKK